MTDQKYDALVTLVGPVSRETYERLTIFESEFRRWAQKINLAAPSTLESLWERHVLDSAQLRTIESAAKTWLDLGSGGGFPGAILAILFAERADTTVSLVESNGKKVAFLQAALGRAGLRAHVHAVRIEDAVGRVAQPEIVTARALAPLDVLLPLAAPWLTRGARGLFHKGRDYRAEIEKCHDAWQFDLVEHGSLIDRDSVILDITNLARR